MATRQQGPVPVLGSGESTPIAHQAALDQLFSRNLGGTGAVLSGQSEGSQFHRWLATWVEPLSGQLADELVSSLV
jgi:hypothetical protein